eukprot:gb/GECH01006760.1/.p1 GENE.gb/GECH01006760.1/~~gb/GECH01006760.1/.p1  ORF type:complete len:1732 (+),score=261.24 gb/GECH01006760.1/:1-5196(+)
MEFNHLKNISPAKNYIHPVNAMVWSPNNKRLAVAESSRVVLLYDNDLELRDKFGTKPREPSAPRTYRITGMAFSPDSVRLAIAQSDSMVFIYKLGRDWGDKKSISMRFPQQAPVTCLAWPRDRSHEVIFATTERKVKIADLRRAKTTPLYSTEEIAVSIASAPDGNGFITGHEDGSIYRFFWEREGKIGRNSTRIAVHSSVPYCLGWGESILAAGQDQRVCFYDIDGNLSQTLSFKDTEEHEFNSLAMNPAGQTAVVGSFDGFRTFDFNPRREIWEEGTEYSISNACSLVSLVWKPDGSRLIIGTLTGSVDVLESCMRRYIHRGSFEFTFTSLSTVIVKRLATEETVVVNSMFGYEIVKINVYQDRYLVAYTSDTLLLGDLDLGNISEVPWAGNGKEKFFFSHEYVCMIYYSGELVLIEYGYNEILGSCRTEYMNPHLVSIQIVPQKSHVNQENKTITYLIDRHTIRILDLVSGLSVATIQHDSKIDWLELNSNGTKLLFRDKQNILHLYSIPSQTRTTLLQHCSYVQWVPGSDVVVAQSRGDLCVWYSIDAPDRVTTEAIKGDIEDVERYEGRTDVLVDEGMNTTTYTLDEGLIQFGAAIKEEQYERAADLLDQLEITPETESMWNKLSRITMEKSLLHIAARCFAAVGDVAKARYLKNTLKHASSEEIQSGDFTGNYKVQVKLAILDQQFKKAEGIYLEHGQYEDARDMYKELHKFEDSINVVEAMGDPAADTMRQKYFEWLVDSNQQDKAAEMREREGNYVSAIQLYLQANQPGRAARVVQRYHLSGTQTQLLEAIASALSENDMHEKAGDFWEKLEMNQRAIDAYKEGNAYRKAIELARRVMPESVVELEEEWGDWLVSQRQVDAAVNHFLEAGQYTKALDAAINSRQWNKAVQILESLEDSDMSRKYYQTIASHFEETERYREAERYYVKAGVPGSAIEMYSSVGMWDDAIKLSLTHMSVDEASSFYLQLASKLENEGKFKEAETLYLKVEEPDLAITMYKENRMFDDMIRLVTKYRSDLLRQTHQGIAKQLESEGNFKSAETHYVAASDWEGARDMYAKAEKWEDAFRIAKIHGGPSATKNVAWDWARQLGGEAGAKVLVRLGMIEEAIDYALEIEHFDYALQLANSSHKSKIEDVHLKHAMKLEQKQQLGEAETEFVKANKPAEAINMYIHSRNWESAYRVADTYQPDSRRDVLIAQGKQLFEQGVYDEAERLFLQAKQPSQLVRMYKDMYMWSDAERVAREHGSHEILKQVKTEYAAYLDQKQDSSENPFEVVRTWEDIGEFSRAIDAILSLDRQHISDKDRLESVLRKAVDLASNHDQERYPHVVQKVSQRLVEIGRHEAAAEILKSGEFYQQAVKTYMWAGMWSQARDLAAEHAPGILEDVKQQESSHFVQAEQPDKLVESGNVDAGIDMYAQHGQWDECLRLASEQGPDTAKQYAGLYAKYLVAEEQHQEALRVLKEYGVSLKDNLFPIYAQLCRSVLYRPKLEYEDVRILRHIVDAVSSRVENPMDQSEFQLLRRVVHLELMRETLKQNGFKESWARICVSLCRYVAHIPADRAFYEAGDACRAVGWTGMALVFLNRFLDVRDAMEDNESDSSKMDNEDLAETNIPYQFPLPSDFSVSEDEHSSISTWVLDKSLDTTAPTSFTLPKSRCPNCGEDMFEGNIECVHCQTKFEECMVTGYPVVDGVQCDYCNARANRNAWNEYLTKMKRCPYCNSIETPSY